MASFMIAPLLALLMLHPVSEEDSVRVSPATGIAGDFGTWTVTYTAGPDGIAEDGGIRVQLPDSWHAGDRNSANPLQASNPTADHYVSAKSSRPEVSLKTRVEGESDDWLVKSARPSLDGRLERYVLLSGWKLNREVWKKGIPFRSSTATGPEEAGACKPPWPGQVRSGWKRSTLSL